MERREVNSNLSLSALQMGLLRSYNPFAQPGTQTSYQPYKYNGKIDPAKTSQLLSTIDFSPILGAFQPYSTNNYSNDAMLECKSRRALMMPLIEGSNGFCHRRSRGEKKAIPDEQKDDRYFERRKRNNQAAKKSRDARKLREDQIALRAAILEHENAMMRAQILTLREETQALRGMLLLNKKTGDRERSTQLPVRVTPYLSPHPLMDTTISE